MRIDPQEADLARILMIGALANNADIEKTNGSLHIIGDPTEGALLVAAEKAGILDIMKSYTRLEEFPFDSDPKGMATVDETAGVGRIGSMKGAPEVLLGRCVSLYSCILYRAGVSFPARNHRYGIHIYRLCLDSINWRFPGTSLNTFQGISESLPTAGTQEVQDVSRGCGSAAPQV